MCSSSPCSSSTFNEVLFHSSRLLCRVLSGLISPWPLYTSKTESPGPTWEKSSLRLSFRTLFSVDPTMFLKLLVRVRSEERRVGKECRSEWLRCRSKKKDNDIWISEENV